jgi:hypothetical protein
MQAPATAVLLNQFAQGLDALAISAVSNKVEEISTGWTPQDAIMAVPNFVNVTYGTERGQVRAQYTQVATGARVPLMAPGCGFEGIAEEGSSLASPYVAASAWFRALLDQVELNLAFSPQAFWRQMLNATQPIPTLDHAVESGGMFDAPMLVAPPRDAHFLLKRDRTIVPLQDFQIRYSCFIPRQDHPAEDLVAGQPVNSAPLTRTVLMPPIFSVDDEFQRETTTLSVYWSGLGKASLWQRTIPLKSFGRAVSGPICDLFDLTLDATAPGGPIHFGLKQFQSEILFLNW